MANPAKTFDPSLETDGQERERRRHRARDRRHRGRHRRRDRADQQRRFVRARQDDHAGGAPDADAVDLHGPGRRRSEASVLGAMRSGRPTLRFFSPLALGLSPLALVLVTALQFGCYKPNIEEGGLLCNLDAGAKMCPEGYRCEMQSRRCYKNPDGAVDRVDMAVDRIDTATEERPPICIEPKPGCTPGSGICDPTCRTGCSICTEKCSVNTIGALTCNEPRMQGYPRMVGQDCTIESAGAVGQTDNCGPGLGLHGRWLLRALLPVLQEQRRLSGLLLHARRRRQPEGLRRSIRRHLRAARGDRFKHRLHGKQYGLLPLVVGADPHDLRLSDGQWTCQR